MTDLAGTSAKSPARMILEYLETPDNLTAPLLTHRQFELPGLLRPLMPGQK